MISGAHYQRYHATFQTVRLYHSFPWTAPPAGATFAPAYQLGYYQSPYQRI
jgi:hypothetical protein